jgi:uncharacterized protein
MSQSSTRQPHANARPQLVSERSARPLAVVTGASSGIGFELARQLVEQDFDVIAVAEDEGIHAAAQSLAANPAQVRAVRCDLRNADEVEALADQVLANERVPDVLALNAGIGLSGRFLETPLERELDIIRVNATSVVHLSKRLLPAMVNAGRGRVLFTASLLSEIPATYMAVYGASKAFVLSFAQAIRAELADTGVTVTAVLPGATDTEFFRRADATDTRVAHGPLDDPADVARDALEALFEGDDKRVAGSTRNAIMAAAAQLTPDKVNAKVHGKLAEPHSAADKT